MWGKDTCAPFFTYCRYNEVCVLRETDVLKDKISRIHLAHSSKVDGRGNKRNHSGLGVCEQSLYFSRQRLGIFPAKIRLCNSAFKDIRCFIVPPPLCLHKHICLGHPLFKRYVPVKVLGRVCDISLNLTLQQEV